MNATGLHESYFGQELRRRRLGRVLLTETVYEPTAVLPVHTHTRPHVVLVLGGGYRERSGSQSHDCRVGTLIFHAEHEEHADTFGLLGGRCFNVEFDQSWLDALRIPFIAVRNRPWPQRLSAGAPTAHRLYQQLRAPNAAAELIAEELAATLVADYANDHVPRPGARVPPWLARARDLIVDECRTLLTLEYVARQVGVHPMSLARSFRRAFGHSVGEYVRELRLQHAATALLTPQPVGMIAFDAGFADHSHLTRAFRQRFGMTPTEYRQQLRAG